MHPINKLLLTVLQRIPKGLVKPVAMRYIAGEELEDAVRVVRGFNARGMMATVDVLGEDVSTREEAEQAREACAKVLKTIQEERLDSNLSIKLTQFGLKIGDRLCIQAYLRRSEGDVKNLIRAKAKVRLVKGIYEEPETIAFKRTEEIRRNYLKLLRMLLEAGCSVGIATHDDFLVKSAFQFIREMNLPQNAYEFQMLYGVRPKLRDQILAGGHRMRIYVPFGIHWYAYSMRRFQEDP